MSSGNGKEHGIPVANLRLALFHLTRDVTNELEGPRIAKCLTWKESTSAFMFSFYPVLHRSLGRWPSNPTDELWTCERSPDPSLCQFVCFLISFKRPLPCYPPGAQARGVDEGSLPDDNWACSRSCCRRSTAACRWRRRRRSAAPRRWSRCSRSPRRRRSAPPSSRSLQQNTHATSCTVVDLTHRVAQRRVNRHAPSYNYPSSRAV